MFSGLREPGRIRAGIIQVILTVIIILVVFTAVQFTMQSFRVEGHSMEPTFPDGEYIVVNKLTYRFGSPQRGDVVVFRNPQMPDHLYIKRIVGLPGDTVEIRGGRIYISGSVLEETPDFAGILCEDYSVTVPDDRYFVVGDNRTATSGSHTFGLVPRDNIVGKTWICYWPPREWGLSPSYAAAAG
ncbi:MAG: signal peptidase I [Chloroflexi bacterium RBG_13_60_13]|nr:MAG: signal peptidase I [Chloroflexi bacterium RBG_13_60_13]